MTDTLRDRIAAVVAGVDDWRGVTDPVILADAVIEALDLANPCATTGCRMRQIARRHAEASSKLEMKHD